jgi:hypothetical protein
MSVNYETVPAPNYAAYANPGFGMALGQMLQGLPDQYMRGRQNARTLDLQRPILNPATGEPSTDPNVVAKELMKRGGAEYSKDLLQFMQKQPIFDKILRENDEGGYDAPPGSVPPSAPPPRPNGSAAAPGNLTLPPQRFPQVQPQALQSSAGPSITVAISEGF